jgi:alpha-mannosidase
MSLKRTAIGLAALLLAAAPAFAADVPEYLWQIGTPDGDDREFALAPAGYEAYPGDPVFVVGVSDPKKDWPYVHPGPTDPWAGETSHTFTVLFGLRKAPDAGGRLAVALVDTHAQNPPTLKIAVNGTAFEKAMPAGAGDASVFGDPAKGRPHRFEVELPAGLLKAGDNEIRISTESGSWVLYDWLGLRAPGAEAAPVSEAARAAASARATATRRGVEQVVVVFKTHFDIGYTDMAANVVQRYRTKMIDDALKVVEQNRDLPPERQFAWTLPGWPLAKIMEDWPGQSPERLEKVRRAFKDGRFVVHALPFSMHTELLETEDLVRGLGHASRLSRGAGLPLPRDAKMTDVAAHAWVVPTLLRRAGVDFLHIGCNAACRSPQVPVLFWWEGPDGSRLLTMYTAENYGTGLVPPKGWPHRTWLALIHTGDNHGPPTPAEVAKLYAEAEKKLPGVRLRIGRLSDFSDAILAEKPELPVVRSDMPDTWIHGPMCDPAGAALARAVRPRIGAAEILDAQLAAWAGKLPAPVPALAAAREQSLLYGEHTWGGALYWVTQYAAGKVKFPYGDAWRAEREKGRFKRLEESWAEHTAYIEKARDLSKPVLDRSLKSLADAVQPEGPRVIVFNPLPWMRAGLVDIPNGLPGGVSGLSQADKTVAVSGVERRGGPARFVANGVSPMGYTTYVPVKADPGPGGLRADEAAATIEGPFFKAVLDPARGAVRSLIDKKTGRELVDAASEHGFGRYLYERFDADQVAAFIKAYVKIKADWALNEIGKPTMPPASEKPYRAAGPTGCAVAFDRSPLSVTAAMTSAPGGDLPHGVTTRVTLYQDLPCVDFEVTVRDKPADPWPEAGWLCFPFAVESPQFRIGRQNSIIDPARDVIAGSNRHLVGVTSGVAIHDPQGRGVGLCAPDSPLMSLDAPGIMKFSMDFVPKRPAVYVNLFNNHWTTNFRMWNEGTWTARVRVWSFEKYDPEASLITPSWEARVPLVAVVADGAGGTLPGAQEGVQLSRRGVLVDAFGANPDGEWTLLRLWEQTGKGGPCRVTLPKGMPVTVAKPCDLRGSPLGAAIAVRDGAFEAALEPFAPASYLLK